MSDIVVRIGNTAPTTSVRRPTSEEESVAAGPLGSKELLPDGSTQHYVLAQEPAHGVSEAITTFIIPHHHSLVDAVRDVGLAFTRQHSSDPAAWVHCDNEVVRMLLANHLTRVHGQEVPELSHKDLEAFNKMEDDRDEAIAKGETPPVAGAAIQAIGRDLWAQALSDYLGFTATSTGVGGTTLTYATGGFGTTQYKGKDVYTGSVVGTINTHTDTVLTVSRWETPGSRSASSAAANPSTGVFSIASGQAPANWMALTADTATPSAGGADTALTSEINAGGGGLNRAVAVYGHTPGAATYTLTLTFTANGSDTLPVTVAKIGVLNAKTSGRLLYETLLSSTATLSTSGDNVQVTDTVTGT